MELRECMRVLGRRFWFIISVTCVAMLVSIVVTRFFISSMYASTTTILINRHATRTGTEAISPADILPGVNVIKIYSTLAQSDAVLERVIADLNLEASLRTLRSGVNVEAREDAGVIIITAEHKEPRLAQAIADRIVKNLQIEANRLMLTDSIHVIDAAKQPALPVRPKLPLNVAVAAVGGVMFSMVYVFFAECIDESIKSPQNIQKCIDLPILGIIPVYNEWICRNRGKAPLKGTCRLIYPLALQNIPSGAGSVIKAFKVWDTVGGMSSQSLSDVMEAYEILRMNIEFISVNKQLKIILITSPGMSEGKTTVAANLAVVMARRGKRVLIMDCNLRHPGLSDFFQSEDGEGLTDFLSESKSVEDLDIAEAHNLGVIYGGLAVIKPHEAVQSPKLKTLIDYVKCNYDTVIIDSPAAAGTADAAALSTIADGVVLVTGGRQSVCTLSGAMRSLNNVHAHMIGVVVNNVHIKDNLSCG